MSLLRTTLNESRLLNAVRVTRSAVFVVVYLIYLILFMGFVQRFILIPLVWVFPVRTNRLLGSWTRLQARVPIVLLRVLAGVRITIEGEIGRENRHVIMNHQSLVDIIIGVFVSPRYLTVIPTRRRYEWGIPGISVLVRLARYPVISQTRKGVRADLESLSAAADRCRRNEASLLIFPEGHRTKDGSILPFMTRGLRIVLSRAPMPVYYVVADGLWQIRTLGDIMARVAGSEIHVRIKGPFQPPSQESEIPDFLTSIREQMIATLQDIRGGSTPPPAPPVADGL